MSWIVKAGKQGKKIVKKLIMPAEKHYVGYTRRICAMTFDDGPMGLPASPDRFDGRTLTDVLLDTLAQYGARGSFDVIGDTSANYPDEAGKLGSAAWGGVRFDHYPDIHCDEQGGAEHNDRLIRRMLAEGHQITNHGYRHILFGKKPFVYGAREYLPGFDAAVEDLGRLHALMQTRYGYTMTLARPPHYVDKMTGGFTSYDVYDRMGYQYMAASFDGAGWLPSTDPDPEAALQAEIRAMVEGAGKRPGLFLRADHFPEGRLQHGQAHTGGLCTRPAAGAAAGIRLSGRARGRAVGGEPLCGCRPRGTAV